MSDALQRDEVPRHLAIIMDGNGRWAERRGLDRSEGHRAGVEAVRQTVRAANDFGVSWLTLYAFSSENWNRPKAEVDLLMKLPEQYFEEEQLSETVIKALALLSSKENRETSALAHFLHIIRTSVETRSHSPC